MVPDIIERWKASA